MSEPIPEFLVALEDAFNEAMISNDVERIAACISEDWKLVTPERGPLDREVILSAIGGGALTHATMTKKAICAKVMGEVAYVTGRGQNTGTFRGAPMQADEWITDVYERRSGVWRCVLTHLTPAQR